MKPEDKELLKQIQSYCYAQSACCFCIFSGYAQSKIFRVSEKCSFRTEPYFWKLEEENNDE